MSAHDILRVGRMLTCNSANVSYFGCKYTENLAHLCQKCAAILLNVAWPWGKVGSSLPHVVVRHGGLSASIALPCGVRMRVSFRAFQFARVYMHFIFAKLPALCTFSCNSIDIQCNTQCRWLPEQAAHQSALPARVGWRLL